MFTENILKLTQQESTEKKKEWHSDKGKYTILVIIGHSVILLPGLAVSRELTRGLSCQGHLASCI